jgi:hypothetical protein
MDVEKVIAQVRSHLVTLTRTRAFYQDGVLKFIEAVQAGDNAKAEKIRERLHDLVDEILDTGATIETLHKVIYGNESERPPQH